MTRRTARELRQLDAIGQFEMDREAAVTEDCAICGSTAGVDCVNPTTGRPLPYPAHWHRLKKAERRQESP